MARTPTTHDPFSAVAEPKRRQLLETLGAGELAVNDIAGLLGWPQPMVSKHLAVLKKVGLVSVRRVGRLRVYRANLEQLKPIQEWIETLKRFRGENLDRLGDYRLGDYLREVQENVLKEDEGRS